MTRAAVDQIADAVLYEGYLLYPYRPSSVKNRQRWTFGGLYPPAYSAAQAGADASAMRTECLVRGGAGTTLRARVRFLRLQQRTVGRLTPPLDGWPATGEPAFEDVESLRIGDKVYPAWQEAAEQEIDSGVLALDGLVDSPHRRPFALPARRDLEPLPNPSGRVVGVLVRQRRPVEGFVELSARPDGEGVFRLTARVVNETPVVMESRDEALLHSLVSTHTILRVQGGEFVSLLDPPEPCRAAAARCENVGTWPVLAGQEGDKDTVLSSPIILYDYPQVAPESPGDLFDATEIDEILTLRILTMTESEKSEMSAADPRARALLDRTEALAREQLAGLHGAVRGLRPVPAGRAGP